MIITRDKDGEPVVQLSAGEALAASVGIEHGLDPESPWTDGFRNKLIRLHNMLRYSKQQIRSYLPDQIGIMNQNLKRYEEQMMEEYPDIP